MSDDRMLDGFRKLIESPTGQPGVAKRACPCGELLTEADHTVRRHSGVVNFSECLCSECRKGVNNWTRIVCLNCKSLLALYPPQRMKTGFEFKPNSCVHVERCPSCRPSITDTPVLEHLRYCRDQGIPTNVDADIVQEAEQKALQGESEADKMRTELQSKFAAP